MSNSANSAFPVELRYVEQSVRDLRYYLLARPLAADRFPILAEQRVAAPWGRATLRVVGASHTCELVFGERTLTEALVCARLALEPGDRELAMPSVAAGPRVAETGSVTVCLQVVADAFSAGMGDSSSGDWASLAATYPTRSGPAGVTRLDWCVSAAGFELVTYHSYPAESTVAVSRSRFTFDPRTRPPAPDRGDAAARHRNER